MGKRKPLEEKNPQMEDEEEWRMKKNRGRSRTHKGRR